LKRAIQREIETPLARKILAGEVRDGQAVVVNAAADGASLSFQTGAVKEAASVS
jgi:ATP-dependent Clp protease ATP-binding subunit ClpB